MSVSSNDKEPASERNSASVSRAVDPLSVAIVIVAAFVFVHSAWRYREMFAGNAVDDAYISFRYLENLVTGHGLVYNPGERVEGFSNLLWILILCPFRLAGFDVVIVSQILGIVFGFLTIVLAVVATRRLFAVHSPLALAWVALLPATSGYFAAWSIGGLEGSLYAFLLLASWFRYHLEADAPDRFPWSPVLLAALAMTRPEGLFVALAAAAYHLAVAWMSGKNLRHSSVRRFVLLLGLLIGLYELFRVVYYGPHLFPNSVRAKVGLSFASIERGIEYIHEHFLSPYLLLLAPLLLLLRPNHHRAVATSAVLVGASVALVVVAGGDWSQGRLFAPILPLGAVAVVGAAVEISRKDSTWRTPASQIILVSAVSAYLLFASFVTNVLGESKFFGPFAPYDAERIAMGKWLREHAPKNTKIAVYAAGEIPYFSGLYAHDMLGLNDAHIASIELQNFGQGIAGHEKSDPDHTLRVIQPDIIIDGQLVPGLVAHPDFAAKYEEVRGFRFNRVYVRTDMVQLFESDMISPPSPDSAH